MIELCITSVLVPWIFGIDCLFCDFGERMTNQFQLFGEEFDRCDWYALPIELKGIYLIFLSNTQQPKVIQSYGGVICSRKTMKRVFNLLTGRTFSYNLKIITSTQSNDILIL